MITRVGMLISALSSFGAAAWTESIDLNREIRISSYGRCFDFDIPKRLCVISLEELESGIAVKDPAVCIFYAESDEAEGSGAAEKIKKALSGNRSFEGVPAVILDRPCPIKEIGEALRPLFIEETDRMTFQNRILSLALDSSDLEEFLRKTTEYTKIPFTLYDSASHLLAHSFSREGLADSRLAKSILKQFVSREFLEYLHYMGFLDVMRKQYGVMSVDLANKVTKVGASIYVKDHYMGMLCGYDIIRMMTDEDVQNLRMICDVITTLIARQNPDFYTFGTQKEMMFFSMLTEELDKESAISRIETLDMQLPENMCLLVIGASDERKKQRDMPAGFIKVDIAPTVHSIYQIVCDFHVIFLLDAWKDNIYNSDFLEKIRDRLKKYDLYAVVSNIFLDPTEMKGQYDMSKELLSIRARKEPGKRIIFASDHIAETVVRICRQNTDMSTYVHPIFRLLNWYDEKYGTNNLETLEEYLLTGGNMSMTAKRLGLHYNTMKYRQNNIKSISNVDINKPEIMMNLYVSMLSWKDK